MTNGILNSIKFRDKLFIKLKKLNPGSELHDHISSNLKSYNKILKKLIRQAKIQYYSDQFDKNKSNIRHTWSTIKEILKNSSGHDGISARFIKRMLDTITPSLTHIINQSLNTGIFPDRLKIAKVIPLFQKGDEHILDNYRPIIIASYFQSIREDCF